MLAITKQRRTEPLSHALQHRLGFRMILTGDASLTQNGNVTKGEKVVYDLTTGVAVVEAAPNSGRVKSLLVPNSSDKAEAKPAKPGQTPAPANPKPPQRP